jgi:hypothetical protein
MKCLSVRQPWAWLIIHGGKDVENRTWSTPYRGLLAIHASKVMTYEEYETTAYFALKRGILVPTRAQLVRGAIIGTVDLTDCVDAQSARSTWFFGPFGFVLANPRPLPPLVVTGRLGLFDIDLE